jgi:Protein of unknown function (DUF3108)
MRANETTDDTGTPSLLSRQSRRLGSIAVALLQALAILTISVVLLPYVVVPVYMFHTPSPFIGARLFNPYAGIGPVWQRANFHAHSRAWSGMTNGMQSPDELRAAYLARGYNVIGISNYHQITRASGDSAFLPIYEHGFSIRKTHQLVIGARRVVAVDFPLWQTSQAKQYLLSELRDSSSLTVINHPYMREGYGVAQLAELSGFDLLEVRSHWGDASRWWDAVLSAGNPVWAIGDDDVHDITKPREIGVVWTEVNAATNAPSAIIDALRRGRMYVVAAAGSAPQPHLESVTVNGDTVNAHFDQLMQRIDVITDRGTVRLSATDARDVSYALRPTDHYARIVATAVGGTLYLNPVLRSSGVPKRWGVPGVRSLASLVTRFSAALIWICAMVLLRPRRRSVVPRAWRVRTRGTVAILAMAFVPVTVRAQSLPSTLPFRSGEYHEYDLKFGVLSVGSGALSVSAPETLRGREVLRLRFEINGGIPFYRLHDVMESWFDPVHLLSLRFTQELNEGSKHYHRFYDFYPDELIVLERGKPRAETVAQPLDDASFLFYVRTLKLEVGQTLTFARYFRPNANPVTIEVLRKETITVPAGTFNTIVVKPIIRTGGIFGEGGRAEVWFSDDSAHTLIQMKAKLSIGSLSLFLRPSRNAR